MNATKVAAVYENREAREQGVLFCDYLVKKFWLKCTFDVQWWDFKELHHVATHQTAVDAATKSDIIVISSVAGTKLPVGVVKWINGWAGLRGEREGTLVALIPNTTAADQKHIYLRQVARRAGLDYLTEIPEQISLGVADSFASYDERAGQVTSVLHEILQHPIGAPKLLVRHH